MDQKISLLKYVLVAALGFGLGGFLWGLFLYSRFPKLEYPLHYIAIIAIGLFGGISLSIFSKNVRKIIMSVIGGWLGLLVGFLVSTIFSYYLFLYGVYILSVVSLNGRILGSVLENMINLEPNVDVGVLWLIFLFAGAITGLSYALFLKLKIWAMIWRGGVGFALASLISPVIGNILGDVLNSTAVSYLVTFSLIGIILGIFLSWGVYTKSKVVT